MSSIILTFYTMASLTDSIEPGQFDDAPEGQQGEQTLHREGNAYIDTFDLSGDEDSEDEPDGDSDDDDMDGTYDDENRVEDEDWEIAERGTYAFLLSTTKTTVESSTKKPDFTKQFNRLRQHAAIRSGNAQGAASATTAGASVAVLPAINQPRPKLSQPVAKDTSAKDKTMDQLAALTSKFNSRLVKIDAPYVLGVGVNRKGPSAHANMKDKSDRATNEQVLDPRTRLILFKMIGRGVIDEVNGCISTGKEVVQSPPTTISSLISQRFYAGECLSRTYARPEASCPQNLQNIYSYIQGP